MIKLTWITKETNFSGIYDCVQCDSVHWLGSQLNKEKKGEKGVMKIVKRKAIGRRGNGKEEDGIAPYWESFMLYYYTLLTEAELHEGS